MNQKRKGKSMCGRISLGERGEYSSNGDLPITFALFWPNGENRKRQSRCVLRTVAFRTVADGAESTLQALVVIVRRYLSMHTMLYLSCGSRSTDHAQC